MNNSDFQSQTSLNGFTMKLWRGERMSLVAFNVEHPEPDLVGFAIECRGPGEHTFTPLKNRLAFDYTQPIDNAVTGARLYPSTTSPFQKFRWVHFPPVAKPGVYEYRGSKVHMADDGELRMGTTLTLSISLDEVTYHDFLDIGFTRGFASSQAFRDRFPADAKMEEIGRTIIPGKADAGLDFAKAPGDIYRWLGFEAADLLFGFLKDVVADTTVTLDVFTYDLNEPDILAYLEKMGPRLRAIMDDSTSPAKGQNPPTGHGNATSAESQAAARLMTSAGVDRIHRTHFAGLQHNKVFIASRHGVPFKVLTGSTNFSFRGIYIQSNNVLVFDQADVAGFYQKVFDQAFSDPAGFAKSAQAQQWYTVPNTPVPVRICFSPHKSAGLSLTPVGAAIDQASSAVLFSIAFLYQTKAGALYEAIAERLPERHIFSYGTSDKVGGLKVTKPDGTTAVVSFGYLAKNAPQPFKTEWSSGTGINIHHKFVVVDFNLPTAKVITGSSNLAKSGEESNGDNLIMIEDQKVAVAYAIEAIRVFDHLHFRSRMQSASTASPTEKTDQLTLHKPTTLSGKPAWFERYYVAGSQVENDRLLFSS